MALTICIFLKYVSKAHPEKSAAGVPHPLGFGVPFVMSAGMLFRAQYQIWMALDVQRVA